MFEQSDVTVFAIFCLTLVALVVLSNPEKRDRIVSKALDIVGKFFAIIFDALKQFLARLASEGEPKE